MIILIVLIDSMKLHYHHKILPSTNYLAIIHAQILNIHAQLEYGMPSGVRQLVIITTYICNWMCCCWLIFSKGSVKLPLHYYTTPGLA